MPDLEDNLPSYLPEKSTDATADVARVDTTKVVINCFFIVFLLFV
jgi:hypothetical protein